MKYPKGTKLYKVDHRGNLITLEIKDQVYILKKGAISGKKYLTESELENAIKSGEVSFDTKAFEERKIRECKEQIKKLQEKLAILEGGK